MHRLTDPHSRLRANGVEKERVGVGRLAGVPPAGAGFGPLPSCEVPRDCVRYRDSASGGIPAPILQMRKLTLAHSPLLVAEPAYELRADDNIHAWLPPPRPNQAPVLSAPDSLLVLGD